MDAASQLSRRLLSQQASRFFLQRFIAATVIMLGLGTLAMTQFATSDFRIACYFGMAIPILSSFASFLISEWAFEQPNAIFLIVALGSFVVRMFNLLLAFVVGLVILKLALWGLIVGTLGTYLSFMVIEISYVHNKGLLQGQ